MSSENIRGLPADYDLTALLRHWQADTMFSTYCHLPGRIEKFYPADQTADVSVSIQKQFDGRPVQLPILPKCPVMVLTGGATGNITMPVAVGDSCLICVADRDIDVWWKTGISAPPNTRRSHDLSDSFVIVGFRHSGNAVASYSSTNVEINNLGSKVSVGAAINAKSVNGAELNLATKAKLANNATSLKTLLDSFIDIVYGQVDTNGDSLNSGTKASLTALKAQVATLLE